MNRHVVSIAYFERLIDQVDFAQHKLSKHDLFNKDKMSAKFAHKIFGQNVEEALESMSLDDTRGIGLYMRCMRWQYDAFFDYKLSPLERLYKIAYVVFVFRIWRKKVDKKKNFVSPNLYCCLEINFHNFIILITYMRDQKLDSYFLPFFCHSQHCESYFRCLRSWAGSQSTKIDGTMFETLSVMRDISSTQSAAHYLSQNNYTIP